MGALADDLEITGKRITRGVVTGGYGLSMSNPVQRAWRDANAMGRHISLNWDAVGTMAGQSALELEPKGPY